MSYGVLFVSEKKLEDLASQSHPFSTVKIGDLYFHFRMDFEGIDHLFRNSDDKNLYALSECFFDLLDCINDAKAIFSVFLLRNQESEKDLCRKVKFMKRGFWDGRSILEDVAYYPFKKYLGNIFDGQRNADRFGAIVRAKHDNNKSSAAAAIATVMKYYFGFSVDERELNNIFGKIGDINLQEIAGQIMNYGFMASIDSANIKELKQINCPKIIGIETRERKYYNVVRGYTDDKHLSVADPFFGNVRVHADEFEECWEKSAKRQILSISMMPA